MHFTMLEPVKRRLLFTMLSWKVRLEVLLQSRYGWQLFATQMAAERQFQQLTGAFFYMDLSVCFKHLNDICWKENSVSQQF